MNPAKRPPQQHAVDKNRLTAASADWLYRGAIFTHQWQRPQARFPHIVGHLQETRISIRHSATFVLDLSRVTKIWLQVKVTMDVGRCYVLAMAHRPAWLLPYFLGPLGHAWLLSASINFLLEAVEGSE